ncbi:hypothetical protein P7K49_012430 [Saguinus oedipus]|uniref:Uncharacterized protein n=1 Tax=Saguinus oedipus TaxID=9490 RepID=A0ABQ9VTG8_SAGOE|nr:hypothetical protein P7K49_012430 [Saguinus oedipus]
MEENSFEFSSDLTPGDQDPPQSEVEEIEKTRRESEYPFTGGLQNEVRDFVNGYKEKRWKNLDPKDSFQNIMSIVELGNTPKNSLSKEGDNLFLSLLWMPNESSVTCPIVTQNLSCVTTDDCSGMKVEKHIRNRHTIAWDTQDLPVETSCLFMKKREIDKNLPHQPIQCPQHGTRMSDKVLRKEQLYATKINYWAFFTTNLSDEDLQLGSDRQPYFGSWPAVLLKFVCEQRPKKDGAHKLTGPDNRGQWIQLIFTSMGASDPGSSPEILIDQLLIGNEDFSPPPETIDSFIETNLRSCLPHRDIPKNALESTQNKKRRQKRIFNLVPNFNLLGQNHMDVKEREKCDLLTKAQGVKIILGEEKDRISERKSEEENKQKLMNFDHHPLWFYLDIIKAPPLKSLLPDDYVVPLDRKTLKMIYLQWKMSVELEEDRLRRKRKKNGRFGRRVWRFSGPLEKCGINMVQEEIRAYEEFQRKELSSAIFVVLLKILITEKVRVPSDNPRNSFQRHTHWIPNQSG